MVLNSLVVEKPPFGVPSTVHPKAAGFHKVQVRHKATRGQIVELIACIWVGEAIVSTIGQREAQVFVIRRLAPNVTLRVSMGYGQTWSSCTGGNCPHSSCWILSWFHPHEKPPHSKILSSVYRTVSWNWTYPSEALEYPPSNTTASNGASPQMAGKSKSGKVESEEERTKVRLPSQPFSSVTTT